MAGARAGRGAPPPYAAFGLIMLPFLSDTTGNWLDLFRTVGWWDDLSHFAHWFLLCAGVGLLLAPSGAAALGRRAAGGRASAPCWRSAGSWGSTRCSSATGKEAGGAYRDTLGDETLGTSGALRGRGCWSPGGRPAPQRVPKRTLTG